jgi:hypothetical protein
LSSRLTWGSDLWYDLSRWRAEAAKKEISGYASADSEGRIVWQCKTASGAMGSVHSTQEAQAEALFESIRLGLVLNVQWHTHGGMSPFFSQTDDEAQQGYLDHSAEGAMYFVCFGGLYALCRRMEWDRQLGPRIKNGTVWLGDVQLPNEASYYHWIDSDYTGRQVIMVSTGDEEGSPVAVLPKSPPVLIAGPGARQEQAEYRRIDLECDRALEQAFLTTATAAQLNDRIQAIERERVSRKLALAAPPESPTPKVVVNHIKKGGANETAPQPGAAQARPKQARRPVFPWLKKEPIKPTTYDPGTVARFTP